MVKLGIIPNSNDCQRLSPFFDGFVSPFQPNSTNDGFDKPFRNKILIMDFLSPFFKKFFLQDGLFSIEITIKSSKGDSICLMSVFLESSICLKRRIKLNTKRKKTSEVLKQMFTVCFLESSICLKRRIKLNTKRKKTREV